MNDTKPALDYRVALLEDAERWYIQLEIKVPKVFPIDMRQSRLEQLAQRLQQELWG